MKNKIGPMSRFGLWLGGHNIDACEKCTNGEIERLAREGYTLLIPFSIALFSYSYCFYYFTDNLAIAIPLGLLLAVIVISIDRAIISLTNLHKLSFTSLLRIFLAIILAILMAEPLIVGVFGDAIHEEQFMALNNERQRVSDPFDTKIAQQEKVLDDQRYDVKIKRDELMDEIDGSGGSLEQGDGPIADSKREALKMAQEDLQSLEKRINPEIQRLRDEKMETLSKLEDSFADGLLGAIKTLHRIAEKEPIVFFSLWALRFALVIIELLPILIKISRRKDLGILEEVLEIENFEALELLKQTSGPTTQKKMLERENMINLEITREKIRAITISSNGDIATIKTLLDKMMDASKEEQAQYAKANNAPISEENKARLTKKINELFGNLLATFENYMTMNFNR